MTTISLQMINRLIEIENQVRYDEPPPDEQQPFVVVERESPILLSALMAPGHFVIIIKRSGMKKMNTRREWLYSLPKFVQSLQ